MNSNYFPEPLDLLPLMPYGRPPALSPPPPPPPPPPPLPLASATRTATTASATAAKMSASYTIYYVTDLQYHSNINNLQASFYHFEMG